MPGVFHALRAWHALAIHEKACCQPTSACLPAARGSMAPDGLRWLRRPRLGPLAAEERDANRDCGRLRGALANAVLKRREHITTRKHTDDSCRHPAPRNRQPSDPMIHHVIGRLANRTILVNKLW